MGQFFGVMPPGVFEIKQICLVDGVDPLQVHIDLHPIHIGRQIRRAIVIAYDQIEEMAAHVVFDGSDMIPARIMVRFAWLGSQVADKEFHRPACPDRRGDVWYE